MCYITVYYIMLQYSVLQCSVVSRAEVYSSSAAPMYSSAAPVSPLQPCTVASSSCVHTFPENNWRNWFGLTSDSMYIFGYRIRDP